MLTEPRSTFLTATNNCSQQSFNRMPSLVEQHLGFWARVALRHKPKINTQVYRIYFDGHHTSFTEAPLASMEKPEY